MRGAVGKTRRDCDTNNPPQLPDIPFFEAQKCMRELIRTNDAVLVSAVVALLESAGIRSMVFDQNMSVLEGSLGVLPRRVLVADEHKLRARKLLEDAGLGHELRPDDD
jgi:hypothetical protein